MAEGIHVILRFQEQVAVPKEEEAQEYDCAGEVRHARRRALQLGCSQLAVEVCGDEFGAGVRFNSAEGVQAGPNA